MTRGVHQYFNAEADFTCPRRCWPAFVRGALNRIDGAVLDPLSPEAFRSWSRSVAGCGASVRTPRAGLRTRPSP